ncbi:type VII secretion target [Actinocrispum wychmicini]|uniref:Excreted virulence factor EspC (Type VII ESX diderm) n=1 Tax=Actinocrispum wychmicini TaxID=1213861 RepID=A0A4R2JSD2_9PSEU|nr:type VII secretion target [Actinocrispum wychmicini]TCO57085.1 excreted virulence factor EspC (type VII ESX diderm) [Actinocrispum wychmicini]
MAPTQDELKVALEAMRSDAGVWTHASDEMQASATAAQNVVLTADQFGWAAEQQGVVGAYQQVQQRMAHLLTGAQTEFDKVATSLRTAADWYEQNEQHTSNVMNQTGR